MILADVHMPHRDGIELGTILAPHTPATPVILMSTNPLPEGSLLPFIRKPFALEVLLTLMAHTLPISAVVALALTGPGVVSG